MFVFMYGGAEIKTNIHNHNMLPSKPFWGWVYSGVLFLKEFFCSMFTTLITRAKTLNKGVKQGTYSFPVASKEGARLAGMSSRLRNRLHATSTLKGGSEAIARGIAIGLFIGLTPTVGFQTALMITVCVLLAGNFPVAFATSFISNPFTVAPLYWGFHELGEAAFAVLPVIFTHNDGGILWGVVDQIVFTGVGSLLIATPVSVGAYLLTRLVLTTISFRHNRHRHTHRAE